MHGRRLPDGTDWNSALQPGDYWKHESGVWYCLTPTGLLGTLRGHEVTEHDDGTITVRPSIFVNQGKPDQWHGYLERGVWRSC